MAPTSTLILDSISSKSLIQLVRKKPELWEKRYVCNFKMRTKREQAWMEVFETLVPSFGSLSKTTQRIIGNRITKRWHNIRDSYKKSLRRPQTKKRYRYSSLLSFLDSHHKKTNQDNTCESEDNNETIERVEEKSGDENDSDPEVMDEVYLEPEFETTSNPIEIERKVKTELKEVKKEDDPNVIDVLTSLIMREQDEDRAFFNSIMPSVKALREDLKLEFRMAMLKTLKHFKEKSTESF